MDDGNTHHVDGEILTLKCGNTHHIAGGSLTLKVELKVILVMTSYDKDSLMVIKHGHKRVL